DDVVEVNGQVEQLIEQRQAEALFSLHVLLELLVSLLRVGGKGIEAPLKRVTGSIQGLLEELVLPFIFLTQRDEGLEQTVDGRHPLGRRLGFEGGGQRFEVIVHGGEVLTFSSYTAHFPTPAPQ